MSMNLVKLTSRPRTGNSISNERGSSLHFRIDYESPIPPKLVLFWAHGYGGHINRPEVANMASHLNKRGVIVASLDFEGHGYSDGERALVLLHDHLVRDFTQFINALVNAESSAEVVFDETITDDMRDSIRSLPFTLMGQSMGGAVTALTSRYIKQHVNYVGSILLAPALGFSTPHWTIVETLRVTAGACLPNSQMPSWFNNLQDNTLTWKEEAVLEYVEKDTWGRPGAVGWNQGLKWGTALMFIDMGRYLQQTMAHVDFPFLIIHDPQDAICDIQKSRELITRAATKLEDKQLIEVPGYRHGLLCNHNDDICEKVLTWLGSRCTGLV